MLSRPINRPLGFDLTRWEIAFLSVLGVTIVGFTVAPWPLESKSLALLHGLCAQRPSHSFWFGAERLPFDARMTGIYGGFLSGTLYLLARGRMRAARVPSKPLLIALALFVGSMAVDGLNSTFDDANLFRLYPPSNLLRFITGGLTGTTLSVFLWLLAVNALWRPASRAPAAVVQSGRDLAAIALTPAVVGLAAMSGWQPLYAPLVVLLIAAAVLALFLLTLTFIALLREPVPTATAPRDLAGPATLALVAAYALMLSIGGGRFLLEALLGLPPVT